MSRPIWDEYFSKIVTVVATRSDCTRDQVGAVLVNKHNRIIATGYNGTTPGQPGCNEGVCPRGRLSKHECPPGPPYDNCIAIHAEINSIEDCSDWETPGSTLYVTRWPCAECLKRIRKAQITRIVAPKPQPRTPALDA